MALDLIRRAKQEHWETLDLGMTGIVGQVPDEIGDLERLLQLKLCDTAWDIAGTPIAESENLGDENNITSLPKRMPPNLIRLLANNTNIEDLTPLSSLALLKYLDVSETRAKNILPLASLNHLESLTIMGTNVGDITPIKQLDKIKHLSLANTKIKNITPLANLKYLTYLDISSTFVTNLKAIARLKSIRSLDFSSTEVTDLSPIQDLIENGLKFRNQSDPWGGIFFAGCPIKNPPPEIIKQGEEVALRYIRSNDLRSFYESKVILVGDPHAGKTSLYRRMYQPHQKLPKQGDRTAGIDVHIQSFPIKKDKMRLNIWDFGGQEILHTTHQFFLTKRSLYVLLIDGSKNENKPTDGYFRKWLGWVNLLAAGSPVLLFVNQKGAFSTEIDLDEFKRVYPQIKSLYRGDLDRSGSANSIRSAIEHFSQELPHVGSQWRQRDVNIRLTLEGLAKSQNTISWLEFVEICEKEGERDLSHIRSLSQFLHDVGVCLHYQNTKENDDSILDETIILNCEWATKGVYQMLLDANLAQKKGRFNLDDQDRVWSDKQFNGHQRLMVALMERFELCYKLVDSKPTTWLVPQFLGTSKPKNLDFDQATNDLVVRYQYGFVPKGILNRLMTRMHRYVQDPLKAWKDGVLFEADGVNILVTLFFNIESNKDELIFRAKGDIIERVKFMSVLTSDLESIHGQFENIDVKKMIPCKCSRCSKLATPFGHDFSKILKMRIGESSAKEVQCDLEPFEMISVEVLLNGFSMANSPNGKPVQDAGLDHSAINRFERTLMEIRRDTQNIPEIIARLDIMDQNILTNIILTNQGNAELISMYRNLDQILSHGRELEDILDGIQENVFATQSLYNDLFLDFVKELGKELKDKWELLQGEGYEKESLEGKWKATIPFIPGFLTYELELTSAYGRASNKLINELKKVAPKRAERLQSLAKKLFDFCRLVLPGL